MRKWQRITKKWVAMLLTLTMCMSLISAPAFADDVEGFDAGQVVETTVDVTDISPDPAPDSAEPPAPADTPASTDDETPAAPVDGEAPTDTPEGETPDGTTENETIETDEEETPTNPADNVTSSTPSEDEITPDENLPEDETEKTPAPEEEIKNEAQEKGETVESEEKTPAQEETKEASEIPAEVQRFLDAVATLPTLEMVTSDNAEIIGTQVNNIIDMWDNMSVTNGEREDVQSALETVYAVFEAVNKVANIESRSYSGDSNSLFGRDYHIYYNNIVDELNGKTLNLNIKVGVGETVIDEGVFRFWDMSYGVYNVSSWDDFDIWSTNENVLKVTAVPNGKSLKIIYEGIADGTAQIKMAFNLTTISTGEGSVWGAGNWGAAACANCTIGTATVGDGTITPGQSKPTVKPNANNIDVYMFCDSYPYQSKHYGHPGTLSSHTDKWTLGEITNESPIDGYEWFCPLIMDMDKWTAFYGRNYGSHMFSMFGHGYSRSDALDNTISAPELGFYWDGSQWQFFEGYLFLIMTEYSSQIDYTVVHEYYTNDKFDGRISETKTDGATGKKIYGENVAKKTIYEDNQYTYKSATPNPMTCSDTPANNVITLRYERMVADKTYTVTYTDGVVGETVFPDQGYEGLKEGYETPAFVGTPTRDGYTFMGWNPTVNSKVSADDADENGNIVYTATWQKNQESTKITGIEKKLVKSASDIPYGLNLKVDVKDITFPNSDGKIIIPNGGSVTLLYKITVTGDAGAAYEVTDTGATRVGGDDMKDTIPDSGEAVIYVTKTFTAANINADGKLENTATVTPGKDNESNTSSTEITPAEEEQLYTVIYTDGVGKTLFEDQIHPGNKIDDATPAFKEIDDDKTEIDENGVVKPIREGYTFSGWELTTGDKSHTGWQATVQKKDADSDNQIIYVAQWQDNGKVTIKKTASESRPAVGEPFDYTIKVTNSLQTPITVTITDILADELDLVDQKNAATSEEDGKTVLTWKDVTVLENSFTEVTVTVKANAAGNIVNTAKAQKDGKDIDDDTVTVTAVNTYTVIYQDGVDDETVFEAQRFEKCKEGSDTPEFTAPTRTGYTFSEWKLTTSKDSNNTGWQSTVQAVDANDDSEIIYVAVWEAKTYTVIYTDGVDNETVFVNQSTAGLYVGNTTPTFNGTPTREGFTFQGWRLNDTLLTPAGIVHGTVQVADANANDEIIYTATWSSGGGGGEDPGDPVDPGTPDYPGDPVEPTPTPTPGGGGSGGTTPSPTPTPTPSPAPITEMPEADVPLANVPVAELPEADVPLANEPEVEMPLVELAEDDVPLADVPKTGDSGLAWLLALLASMLGLGFLGGKGRKEAK